MDDERGPLLEWQWRGYPDNHADRRNLAIHLVAVPVFIGGLGGALAGALTLSWPLALGGALAMAGSMAAQGAGHRRERVAPVAFRGPLDVAARILSEQLVTFPRFVVSGELARAWREAGERDERGEMEDLAESGEHGV